MPVHKEGRAHRGSNLGPFSTGFAGNNGPDPPPRLLPQDMGTGSLEQTVVIIPSTFTTKLLSSKGGHFLLRPGFFHPGDLRAIYKACLQFRVSDLLSSRGQGSQKMVSLGARLGPSQPLSRI